MKVRADEHVSTNIVKAIREIALSPGWEITSISDVGDTGTSDEYWITTFAEEGGDAILTADKDFLKREPQINAIFDTGLKIIHLPRKWAQAQRHLQAAFILQWWKRIEKALENMEPKECLRPNWNINEDGQIKKIKVDFAKAQKQRRRSNRSK